MRLLVKMINALVGSLARRLMHFFFASQEDAQKIDENDGAAAKRPKKIHRYDALRRWPEAVDQGQYQQNGYDGVTDHDDNAWEGRRFRLAAPYRVGRKVNDGHPKDHNHFDLPHRCWIAVDIEQH